MHWFWRAAIAVAVGSIYGGLALTVFEDVHEAVGITGSNAWMSSDEEQVTQIRDPFLRQIQHRRRIQNREHMRVAVADVGKEDRRPGFGLLAIRGHWNFLRQTGEGKSSGGLITTPYPDS